MSGSGSVSVLSNLLLLLGITTCPVMNACWMFIWSFICNKCLCRVYTLHQWYCSLLNKRFSSFDCPNFLFLCYWAFGGQNHPVPTIPYTFYSAERHSADKIEPFSSPDDWLRIVPVCLCNLRNFFQCISHQLLQKTNNSDTFTAQSGFNIIQFLIIVNGPL